MPSVELIHKAHQPGSDRALKLQLALEAKQALAQVAAQAAEAALGAAGLTLRTASAALPAAEAGLLNGLADVIAQAQAKIRAGEDPALALGLAGRFAWRGPAVSLDVAGTLLASAQGKLKAQGSLEAKAALPLLGGALQIAARMGAKGVQDVRVGLAVPLARRVALGGMLDLGRGDARLQLRTPGVDLSFSPRGGALSWRMGVLRVLLAAGWGARR